MKLAFDPAEATAALMRADRKLARVIECAGPFTLQPERMQSPFHALMRAIVYQQLSGAAARTIMSRVTALFAGNQPEPQSLLELSDELLRAAGMSRGKILSVRDLAVRTLDGTVPTLKQLARMSDEQILERLVQIRGIGPWTVEMLLIFRLGRPDVLPVSDLGIRKGFMLTYKTAEMPNAQELLKRGQRWRPYRSVASWYLWRAVDLDRNRANGKQPEDR